MSNGEHQMNTPDRASVERKGHLVPCLHRDVRFGMFLRRYNSGGPLQGHG